MGPRPGPPLKEKEIVKVSDVLDEKKDKKEDPKYQITKGWGQVGDKPALFLFDSGSSHNIILPELAASLGIVPQTKGKGLDLSLLVKVILSPL